MEGLGEGLELRLLDAVTEVDGVSEADVVGEKVTAAVCVGVIWDAGFSEEPAGQAEQVVGEITQPPNA